MINKGLFAAFGAFLMWGFLPLYIKLLKQSSALEILAHRTLWCLVFLLIILLLKSRLSALWGFSRDRHHLINATGCALLLGTNWLIYTWAVISGHIVESSLGYFINPLISVLLGMVFLKERLRPLQWLPIGIAASGVIYLTVSFGRLPWISLMLATSFGIYGLLRKGSKLGAMEGLTLETAVFLIPSLFYLLYLSIQGVGSFNVYGMDYNLLLIGSGIVTALPLALFGYAARQINLSTLGMMQYIAPSLQLCVGVLIFNEPFSKDRLIGFSLIWLALILFTGESLYRHYRYAAQLK